MTGDVTLQSEERPQLLAEDHRGTGEGDGQENHGPDAEGGGEGLAVTEVADEFIDGFGDGEMLALAARTLPQRRVCELRPLSYRSVHERHCRTHRRTPAHAAARQSRTTGAATAASAGLC